VAWPWVLVVALVPERVWLKVGTSEQGPAIEAQASGGFCDKGRKRLGQALHFGDRSVFGAIGLRTSIDGITPRGHKLRRTDRRSSRYAIPAGRSDAFSLPDAHPPSG